MYDLKGMGESNCAWNRKMNLTPDLLMVADSIYREMYGNDGEDKENNQGIPATYQILYFIAWKADKNQVN